MSLILDALKKSEAERQRQSGPTLLEVRVSAPRRRYPTWVIVVGVLLAMNILLLLIFALRRPAPASGDDTLAPPLAAAPAVSPPAPAGPATPASVAPGASPTAAPALSQAVEVGAPAGGRNSALASDVGAAPEGLNPADNEPAVPASGSPTEREPASRYAGLPSYTDLAGDMPNLRLDLHVYAQRPADRYALINMHRLHEGDTLPEGPRVLAITREGVALEYRGQQFMLHPQ
ncbi:MAG TPA: general secretion pathway protein GspB [Steroidobacteraceae bacterium]|jgi:general secretion pathway protein B